MYRITLSTLLSFITLFTYSQFTIDGEFRTRGIVSNGYKMPALTDSDPSISIDQRSRLRFNYNTEKYSTRFSVQDARVWGSDDMINKTGTEGNSYSFGVHEAWVDFNINHKTNIKIGRQEWNYNDMRIISWKNWWTSGSSYDAILLKRHDKESGLYIDLGISYNNNGKVTGTIDNSDWDMYKIKSMNFMNVKKNMGQQTSIAAMMTISTKVDTGSNTQLGTGTHGIIINHNTERNISDGLFATASAYYQHGSDINKGNNGTYKNISAYLASADIGYRFLDKKLELSVGGELISGHDQSNTDASYQNTRHSFDMLYGSRFPYYGGNMNHFLYQDSYSTGTKGGGYASPHIKTKYKFSKKSIISAGAYFPLLTTKVKAHTSIDQSTNKPKGSEKDAAGNQIYLEGSLGNYVDIDLTHKFRKSVIMKAGASFAMVSDIKNQLVYGYKDVANKELYNSGINYMGWVMIIVKPTFLNNNIKK